MCENKNSVLLPLGLLLRNHYCRSQNQSPIYHRSGGGRMAKSRTKKESSVSCCANICNKPKRGEDYDILQALLSTNMPVLFVATLCGLVCSLTAVDNLGQIGESLGYPNRTIDTFVSLLTVWNYFGRVFSGFVSERILLRWKVPQTHMMTFALVLPAIGDFFVAWAFLGSVYIASLLIGFSYGAQLTLLFIIISELFGLKSYILHSL